MDLIRFLFPYISAFQDRYWAMETLLYVAWHHPFGARKRELDQLSSERKNSILGVYCSTPVSVRINTRH